MLRRLSEPWRQAGLIFLITRGALFLMAPLAYLTLPRVEPAKLAIPPLVIPELTDTFSGLGHYFIDIWARWDSVWFLLIANDGYARGDNSTAFFPLYPLLIAAVKPLFLGNGLLAGIFISLGCCLVAFYLLYRLVELDFDAGVARRSVLYLAIFPTSFFFQAVYSESLFLALTIGCLYLARRRELALACILGSLATLTRSAGLLLLVPLVIMYLMDKNWDWRKLRPDALCLLLLPLGLGVWMLYLYLTFGDPWLFTQAQHYWLREFTFPLEGLYQGFRAMLDGIDKVVTSPDASYFPIVDRDPRLWATYDIMNFSFAVTFLALSIAAFWRLPLAYAAYALVVLLLPLSYPSSTVPLFSMPRFVLAAFPVFILLAIWGERHRWVDLTVTVTSLVFLGLLAAKYVTWTWVA